MNNFNSMNRNHNRKYFFFLLMVIYSTCVQSQPYYRYINHTSEWSFYGNGSNLGATTKSHYRYVINGDTTIGQFTYFKLRRQGVDTTVFTNGNPAQVHTYNEYSGALREDAQSQFFLIYSGQTTEELLYDFRFSSFFSMPATSPNQGCHLPPITLHSADKLYLGTTPLLRYHLSAFGNPAVIEGVGSDREFIRHGNLCAIGYEYNTYLTCYKKDNNLLIVNNLKPCGVTLTAGGPDCQAKFCYSYRDTIGGLSVVSLASTSMSNDPIISYHWDLGDGYTATGQNLNNHLYTRPGTYITTLTIRTGRGCSSTITDTLKTRNTCNGSSPGLQDESIVVAPTVVKSFTTIYLKNMREGVAFIVYDMVGRKVREVPLYSPTTIFYKEGLGSGTYIYRVMNKNKVIKAGKIIIQ